MNYAIAPQHVLYRLTRPKILQLLRCSASLLKYKNPYLVHAWYANYRCLRSLLLAQNVTVVLTMAWCGSETFIIIYLHKMYSANVKLITVHERDRQAHNVVLTTPLNSKIS